MQGVVALQRYFDFSGRSARAEYWQFLGLFLVTLVIAYSLDIEIGGVNGTPTLLIIAFLAMAVPAYAVAFRRLHDRGRTGWWGLASIVVSSLTGVLKTAADHTRYTAAGDVLMVLSRGIWFVNLGLAVFLLIEFLKRGEEGANRYGPDPLIEPAAAPTIGDTLAKAKNALSTPPVPVTAATPRRSDEDPLAQIERLAKLRESGMLTEEEFSQQKAAYLGRL